MQKKHNWILFLFFALLLVVIRLPILDLPLDNDSAANAFFARQMMRGETLYDKFHPAHHVPGIYFTFELAFRLFGDHPIAPILLWFLWTFACILLLYYMGRMCFDGQVGIIAAIFFILVSSQLNLAGLTVEMEHFANLPIIAGIFLLVVLIRRQAPAWQFIWLGLLGALGILYKVTYVASLVVAGFSIPLMAWLTRKEAGAGRTMFFRLLWMTTGLIIPLALVTGYFASLGLWNRFLLIFELGFNYFNDPHSMNGAILPPPFGYPLVVMTICNGALLFFGLMGTYRLARRAIPIRSMDSLMDVALVLWLVISFALVGLRGGGFPHYVLSAVPPLAFMAAIEIHATYQRWTTSSEKLANAGRGIFIALVIVLFVRSNYSIYRDYMTYKFARISHDDFLQNTVEEEFVSQQVSNYLKAHTYPDDFIYIWGIGVEPYYYADRLPPIDILWPSYVAATGSPERIFDPRTKYIVLDKHQRMERPQWLLDGLAADYDLETILEGQEFYRRRTK